MSYVFCILYLQICCAKEYSSLPKYMKDSCALLSIVFKYCMHYPIIKRLLRQARFHTLGERRDDGGVLADGLQGAAHGFDEDVQDPAVVVAPKVSCC